MRHQYLRNCHRGVFDGMLLKGTLNARPEEIDRQANKMLEFLTIQMVNSEDVTEQLKADDQMEWIRRMNSIRARAKEFVCNDLICT